MVNARAIFSGLKSWSNFRLMVVTGTTVTLASLVLGAVVVQASLSGDTEAEPPRVSATASGGSESAGTPGNGSRDQAPTAGGPTTGNQAPPLPSGEDFRITCPVGNQDRVQNTCRIESFSGFESRVQLSCAGLPPGLSCRFTPVSVVPPPNGSSTFRIDLDADGVRPGSHVFEVVGRSGSLARSFRYPWGQPGPQAAVAPAQQPAQPAAPAVPALPATGQDAPASDEPTFTFTCGSLSDGEPLVWSLSDGTAVTINCFLTPDEGFAEEVEFTLTEAGTGSEQRRLIRPGTIRFLMDQLKEKKLFDLTFSLADEVAELDESQLEAGVDYPFEVTATSSETGKALTRTVILTITR